MMNGWWVADVLGGNNGLVVFVSWVVVVIGSIVLHELAHGWAAISRGDRTPIETGHMTWNPVVHMGPYSLLLFVFLGIAFGFMPVNPSRMRGRYAEAFVAAAGPAMNVALAVVCIILAGLIDGLATGMQEPLRTNLYQFFFMGAWLNILLCLFNLLPFPPLDGSRILGNFFPSYANLWYTENGRWVALGIFLLVFFFAFDYIVPAAQHVSVWGVDLVAGIF